jgi:thiol-disulfide isomerase/thioredoxin
VIRIKPLFLSIILLLATGCSDKKKEKSLPSKKIQASPDSKEKNNSEKNCSENNDSNCTKVSTMLKGTTILKSIKDETHSVILDENRFILNDVKKPIVLVNFFSTWCPPCRGQLPYFEDLQKKYKKDLFIVGILVNDDANATQLEKFYKKYHMGYFVSTNIENEYITTKAAKALELDENITLPLTILYKNGNYYTHYEGVVPVEMIDHDIHTALKNK